MQISQIKTYRFCLSVNYNWEMLLFVLIKLYFSNWLPKKPKFWLNNKLQCGLVPKINRNIRDKQNTRDLLRNKRCRFYCVEYKKRLHEQKYQMNKKILLQLFISGVQQSWIEYDYFAHCITFRQAGWIHMNCESSLTCKGIYNRGICRKHTEHFRSYGLAFWEVYTFAVWEKWFSRET